MDPQDATFMGMFLLGMIFIVAIIMLSLFSIWIRVLIAADKVNIPFNLRKATAIDLDGRNIMDAAQTSVNPRVIDAPDPSRGKDAVDSVTMECIQLRTKARMIVRVNIERLVGGATEGADAEILTASGVS